jgi:glutaminyl-tRNA synthetase
LFLSCKKIEHSSRQHFAELHPFLYDRLLSDAHLGQDNNFLSHVNPYSLEILTNCRLEASLKEATFGNRYQFERQGYFFVDPIDSKPGNLVFNRIVTLKDSWSKKQPQA